MQRIHTEKEKRKLAYDQNAVYCLPAHRVSFRQQSSKSPVFDELERGKVLCGRGSSKRKACPAQNDDCFGQ